ncbi:porin family protein [Formosa maritima]|uniref:PorT family protein n=1 Tax=Formosa maritima TaxID=2592046 RepID=A0A5D0G7K4_9FLAO|nr:porin family protein [Formosa maritima]TYA53812.1 PorT family protein [Formosa maritima]
MKHFNKLIVLAFVLLTSGSFAQETKMGIRLGIGLPNLKSTDDNIYSKDYETVAGFDGGIFLDYGLTENFSIKTELYYARKGGDRNGMQPIPSATLNSTPEGQQLSGYLQSQGIETIYATFDNRAVFDYIGIPVLAKYEWNLGDKWGVYANAGLYVEFILSPEQVTSGESQFYLDEAGTIPLQIPVNIGTEDMPNYILVDVEGDLTATTDIDSDLADMDFGAMFGGGVTYNLTDTSELIFDFRGSYGFIPLQNDTDTYGTVHMGSFVFSLGYAYTFKRKSKEVVPNE